MAKKTPPPPQPKTVAQPPAQPAATPLDLTGDKPVCPYCSVACVAGHSSNAITYYYCPTAGCKFSAKRLRRDFRQKMVRDRVAGRPKGEADGAPRS